MRRGIRSLVSAWALGMAILAAAGLTLLTAPAAAWGQGLVDHRAHVPFVRSFEVKEFKIDGRVRGQMAEMMVSQTFHNPGSFEMEVEYFFPVPEQGTISNFVLMVDGKEIPGKLLPKDEARRIYEGIVRSKRDPALLEYAGQGLYKTSVFPVPARADRTVTLRYSQLLPKNGDLVEFVYPLASQKFTAKPIANLAIDISLETDEDMKAIYSPSHDIAVERRGERSARIKLKDANVVPMKDFRLLYGLTGGAVGASVVSTRPTAAEDGYFLLLASPKVQAADAKPLPKSVIFVLDRSGSMAGKKFDQAIRALKFVIENLKDDDLFNIIAYDDRVETFKPELQRYNAANRAEALRFVENLRPGGSTNINEALKQALGMIKDDSKPNYVMFLTDGLPTVGETSEMRIADNAKSANALRSRIFVFGVGYDVNSRLLDRISGNNSGYSVYVKPDDNIESSVASFYNKLTSPVLAKIEIELDGVAINRTYPRDLPDLFDGGQLVIAGRYPKGGKTRLTIKGKVGAEQTRYEFPIELAESGGSSRDFVELLWATRRIGFLIDELDLRGSNAELTKELVDLSTKYGILTPYTSYLADDTVRLHARANVGEARDQLRRLSDLEGASGVMQREFKGRLAQAERGQSSADFDDNFVGSARGGADAKAASGPAPAGPGGGGQTLSPRNRYAFAPSATAAGRRTGAPGSSGMMGGVGAAANPRPLGSIATQLAKPAGPSDRVESVEKREKLSDRVKRLGDRTFYLKEGRWVDSSIKEDDLKKAKQVKLVQFSDGYFELARKAKPEWNAFLALDEPVTVILEGTIYLIDPEKKAEEKKN